MGKARCGRLFCDDHTKYQMKLSPSAVHDPEHGIWCRVCRGCYEGRPGYKSYQGMNLSLFYFIIFCGAHIYTGATRSWTTTLVARRSKTAQRIQLELNLLQKRIEKVTKPHCLFIFSVLMFTQS
jgi:hypothetical protein